MAARNRPGLSEATRARIKTSMILNRLTNHILETDKEKLMTQSQVTAALGLMKKTLPDLQSTELTGSEGTPLFEGLTVKFVNAK